MAVPPSARVYVRACAEQVVRGSRKNRAEVVGVMLD